jgi:exodeoxyribonuclease-3
MNCPEVLLMRVVSANLNGIRSAASKGFFDWLETSGADVVCIQETKAQEHQLDLLHRPDRLALPIFYDAHKPGYSGTAIYQPAKA